MLYLTRKIGETIVINNNIIITVQEIRGKNVKLGFSFPKDTTILRKEIFDLIVQENQLAIQDISFHDEDEDNDTN